MSNVNEIEVISISSDSDNDVGTVEVRSEGSELEDGEIVDADEGKDVVIGGNQTHALAIRGLPKHYRKSGKVKFACLPSVTIKYHFFLVVAEKISP